MFNTPSSGVHKQVVRVIASRIVSNAFLKVMKSIYTVPGILRGGAVPTREREAGADTCRAHFAAESSYWSEPSDHDNHSCGTQEISAEELSAYTGRGGRVYGWARSAPNTEIVCHSKRAIPVVSKHIGELILFRKADKRVPDPTSIVRGMRIQLAAQKAKGYGGWRKFMTAVVENTSFPGEWDEYVGTVSKWVFGKNPRSDEVVSAAEAASEAIGPWKKCVHVDGSECYLVDTTEKTSRIVCFEQRTSIPEPLAHAGPVMRRQVEALPPLTRLERSWAEVENDMAGAAETAMRAQPMIKRTSVQLNADTEQWWKITQKM